MLKIAFLFGTKEQLSGHPTPYEEGYFRLILK